jgi:hypothetical protein
LVGWNVKQECSIYIQYPFHVDQKGTLRDQ